MSTCYLCGQPVDPSRRTGDHVVPRTLIGHRPPKVRGFDYGGKLPTHPECNNRFGDEANVRQAVQLLGALYDSDATIACDVPGNRNAILLALDEKKLPGFTPRDFRFFGIHDARRDSLANLDDPEYYADKPRADPRKTALCTTLSVLAKSSAALLVRRHITEVPSSWNIVCVPYVGDVTQLELSSFFGETRPFANDVSVYMKRFEPTSWVALYLASNVMVWVFFVTDDDRNLVKAINSRFANEPCYQFQGKTLMDLVGHGWPTIV